MYFIIPYWTEPCYRASVNGLLVNKSDFKNSEDANTPTGFNKHIISIWLA